MALLLKHCDGTCRYCRHPGYFGWFVWVIGTQLLLMNPLCLTGFSYVVCNAAATPVTSRFMPDISLHLCMAPSCLANCKCSSYWRVQATSMLCASELAAFDCRHGSSFQKELPLRNSNYSGSLGTHTPNMQRKHPPSFLSSNKQQSDMEQFPARIVATAMHRSCQSGQDNILSQDFDSFASV